MRWEEVGRDGITLLSYRGPDIAMALALGFGVVAGVVMHSGLWCIVALGATPLFYGWGVYRASKRRRAEARRLRQVALFGGTVRGN